MRSRTDEHLRILVVDNQGDSVQLTVLLLEELGHDCRFAFDGANALELEAIYRPHVVLLELELPDITGHAVAAALRALPDGAHLYIAALTSSYRDLDRRRALAAGCDRYLVKPAKQGSLRDVVRAGAQRANLHR